jgi:hypothetical protein
LGGHYFDRSRKNYLAAGAAFFAFLFFAFLAMIVFQIKDVKKAVKINFYRSFILA